MRPRPASRGGDRRPVPIQRLLALARPEWPLLAVATVFLLGASGLGLAYPLAIQELLERAVERPSRDAVDRAALLLVAVFAGHSVFAALRLYLFGLAGERVVARLRSDLFDAVMAQEIALFDERRTGELTSRLTTDATTLQSTVTGNLSMGLRNLLTAIGGSALLLWRSPGLTLWMVAFVPVAALGGLLLGRRVRRLSRETQDALAQANEVADEAIAGIRTVRAFTQERRTSTRYAGAIGRGLAIARRRIGTIAVFAGGAVFLGYGTVATVLWLGGRQVADGAMGVGELVAFLLYTLIVAFALSSLAELWADFLRAGGAAERVFELLDREPAMPLEGGARPERCEGRLAFRGVSFAYPSRPDATVLSEIDLAIEPGEVVALVGASGAGKSTVANLVLRLYDPTAGTIELDERPLGELDPRWLRERIGVVAQEPILFAASIEENVRYGRPDASDEEVRAAGRAAHVDVFAEALPEGWATQVGERGIQLSGGQKQRVAIARALLRDPPILILDEATSALDAESEALVRDALAELMRGRTTLVIAHRLSTVRDAHRVLVVEAGRIVQEGDHAALMAAEGPYRRLVARQFVALGEPAAQ